jgi:hypothetical protein
MQAALVRQRGRGRGSQRQRGWLRTAAEQEQGHGWCRKVLDHHFLNAGFAEYKKNPNKFQNKKLYIF